jgi:hypothetical protein
VKGPIVQTLRTFSLWIIKFTPQVYCWVEIEGKWAGARPTVHPYRISFNKNIAEVGLT